MRMTEPTSAPRRILLVADCVGGVWQYSLELARGLSHAGVEVILAVAGPPPTAAQRAQAEAIPGLRIQLLEVALDWMATWARAGALEKPTTDHTGKSMRKWALASLASSWVRLKFSWE